ncbi:MAG TPA: hypothetical protein VKE40_22630 [Gemmataceae bacterium]|nr:hypothetical protein [Gemmataceae bacterium]
MEDVAFGRHPVLVVIRDEGVGGGLGGWQFYDGNDVSSRPPVAIAKPDPLKIDPSLAEITDLPVGWRATRSGKGQPWIRERL